MTLILDKAIYDSLSNTEKTVVDYLENNQNKIETLSITSIAKKTFTSVATVSRAIRKLGFDGGITELRYHITNSNNEQSESMSNSSNMSDILMKSYRECVLTIDNMSITDILQIVDYIKSANRIFIFALGSSSLISSDFRDQLLYLGYNSILINDEVVMSRSKFQLSPNDLAIFVTASNTSPKLYKMAKSCVATKTKVVTLTCKENTNISSISDVVILGHTEPVVDCNIMTTTSRIPLMIIIRTIVEYAGM